MIKIENVEIMGLESAIKASKYPMAIDTHYVNNEITETIKRLGSSPKGEGHDQFLTGIAIAFDLTCSNKMWIELERYRFIYFVSSQSTMHRITKFDLNKQCNKYVWNEIIEKLQEKIKEYNEIKDKESDYAKELYLEILYNVPAGFMLTARLITNYRALKTVYSQRKNHRLPEWREFCKWIETLPLFKTLVLGGEKDGN